MTMATVSYLPTATRPAVSGRSVREVFESVFARTHVRLVRHLVRLCHDHALAEDLAAEVYADVWRRMSGGESYEPYDEIFPLLTVKARWAWVHHCKRAHVQHEHLAGVVRTKDGAAVEIEPAENHAGPATADTEHDVIGRAQVAAELAQLTGPQARVVALHVLADLPLTEVAQRLGQPRRTVQDDYERAMAALRQVHGVPQRTALQDARERRQKAAEAYHAAAAAGRPLSFMELGKRFGQGETWARKAVVDSGGLRHQRPQTVNDRVKDSIRAGLLGGRWQPGQRMTGCAKLAEQFGVSSGAVNKAMAQLAHDGYLDKRPTPIEGRLGYYVPTARPQDHSAPAALAVA